MNKTYFYARVSSRSQNLDRQIMKFKDLGADDRDIITDKASGKDFDRTGYITLKTQLLRDGDTLVVCSLDRLGRNKAQIKEELEYFKKHNIRVKILDLPTTLIEIAEGQDWILDMVNNILIEVLGSISQQERETIKARQKDGIKAAKENNVKFGRPKAEKPSNWDEVIKQWESGSITAVQAMKETGLTKTTFYKLLKGE